jgi:hypothetical protein
MSRFLRNAIVSARDPGASLRARVPSPFADLGGRGQDALEVESLLEAERIGHGQRALLGETMRVAGERHVRSATIEAAADRAPAALLPQVTEETTRVRGSFQHPPTTPRDDGCRASDSPAAAAPTSDVANAAAEILGPRLARSAREDSGDVGTRGPLEPSLREPWHAAEARGEVVAAPSPRRASDVETRGPRARADKASAPSNDVEIHIGRIEVIAAAPTVRAPPKSTHKSPSLGDYLNGRRGRRP